MNIDRAEEKQKILRAQKNPSEKEAFLEAQKQHILKLTAHIIHTPLSMGDDEWSIAFSAVAEAIDNYDEEKGDFWKYAAIVIKSRITDWYRSQKYTAKEISVQPEAFSDEIPENDPGYSVQKEVARKMAVQMDFALKDEIEALGKEISDFGFSFFDLAECFPRAQKTRKECAQVMQAIFLPPPLVALLRKQKCLPANEILIRAKVSRKMIDRHRKYLIATAMILDGDYPGLSEYLTFLKPEDKKDSAERRERT